MLRKNLISINEQTAQLDYWKTTQNLPTQVMLFYRHTKTTTEIIIFQKISRYKPIMEGSEYGLEIDLNVV